jgi:hypothetical protein
MNNNYKLKYYKYKNKYLELKGGKIPIYNPQGEPISIKHILPYEHTRDNIILNPTTYNYEITDKVFSKIDMLNYLENTIVINAMNKIPFEILFMQDSFGILENLRKLLKYYFTSEEAGKIIDTQFKNFFVFNKTDEYITLSSSSNILTKYILINKIVEFLNILYDDDANIEERIRDLYNNERQNIIDMADLVGLYESVIKRTPVEKIVCKSTKNTNKYKEIMENEVNKIKELKAFITIIDSDIELNTFLDIKPSLLFFASYIGERINNPMLTRGGISNKLFPINLYNLTCNLLRVPVNTQLNYNVTPELKTLQKYFSSSDLPRIYNYGSSTYMGNNYPDCVETALLLIVRCLFYNISTRKYDIGLLEFYPKINSQLKELVTELTTENENSEYIKNKFSLIVSNLQKVKYKNGNYEIISSIKNAAKVLRHLFIYQENLIGKIKSTDITGINNINFNDDNGTITINYNNNQKIILKFSEGHASVGYSNESIETYKYKNIVILLTNKYYIYDNLKFNIYEMFLKCYIDKNILVIPKYLNFLMLNENLYFIGDGNNANTNNDFCNIVYRNKYILNYIIRMNKQDIIYLTIKSRLVESIYGALFIENIKNNNLKNFYDMISSYEIPKTLIDYINKYYFENTGTFNDVYTIDDFGNHLACKKKRDFKEPL